MRKSANTKERLNCNIFARSKNKNLAKFLSNDRYFLLEKIWQMFHFDLFVTITELELKIFNFCVILIEILFSHRTIHFFFFLSMALTIFG